MIKVILFDLWNTLVYEKSALRPIDKFMIFLKNNGVENPTDFMDRVFCKMDFSTIGEAAEYLSRKLGWNKQKIEPMLEKFDLIEPTPFPDVIPAIKKLKKNFKLALISNIGLSLWAFQRTGLERLFNYHFYSCKVGMIKQNPEFFRHALKEMGIKPQEAVMVGDCMFADIDPAESVGIKSVLIKREGFPLHYVEKETYKRTIKTLNELDRYLKP
jgi:HAD superfamily hydrolase (TIGR01509 family)